MLLKVIKCIKDVFNVGFYLALILIVFAPKWFYSALLQFSVLFAKCENCVELFCENNINELFLFGTF